jgi:uncharacterized MAPEG superfamily protein
MLGAMPIPFLCILIAFALCYAPKLPLAIAQSRQPEGTDNRTPRAQQEKLEGWGARARGAHLNSFESFPAFAAAVIVAHLCAVDQRRATILALFFVVSRVVYIGVYLADLPRLRSTVFSLGMASIAALFLLPYFE